MLRGILPLRTKMSQIPGSGTLSLSTSPTWNNGHSSSLVTSFYDLDGRVALLTLNNPTKMNALTEEMGNDLVEQAKRISGDPKLRAVIITGKGKAFSSGGDLDWLLAKHQDPIEKSRTSMLSFYRKFLSIRTLLSSVPVIAAVNGHAIGAGMCLAIGPCDFRMAHENARLGLTFVRLGIHPGMAATHFLPRIVGLPIAKELLLTGRTLSAEEALRCGLVDKVSADPLSDALSLAKEICRAAPLAVKETLQSLRMAEDSPGRTLEDSIHREAEAQAATYKTLDLVEGVTALKEKREPKFIGK